ncbi:hypothetical protein JCM10212_005445 [Sporobolomyces blumeae]
MPPQADRQPTTLHSLPPELISHVLYLACASDCPLDDPPSEAIERRRRWRTLNALSLVCSTWRIVAQRLLFGDGHVRTYHARELDPLVDLVVGRTEQAITTHLRSLDLTMWGESLPDRLVELLRLCTGLETLVMEHVDRVRFDHVVCSPNLRSFSARQCTFISSTPFSSTPSPYPSLHVFPSLRSLDLRLNSFRRESLPTRVGAFPNLNHLLLFTGSQDQSEKTVKAFLRAVAWWRFVRDVERGAIGP